MDNGLSFDTVQEPAVPEQSRLFIIVAIGLVGMLVLGLLGIGGYVVFARTKRATAAHTQTNAVAFLPAATATIMVTNTPPPTLAVAAPAVRATHTPVVVPPTPTAVVIGAKQVIVPVAPTRVVAAAQPKAAEADAEGAVTEESQEPDTPPETGVGFGALGLGGGLAALALLARRMRLSV